MFLYHHVRQQWYQAREIPQAEHDGDFPDTPGRRGRGIVVGICEAEEEICLRSEGLGGDVRGEGGGEVGGEVGREGLGYESLCCGRRGFDLGS